MTATALHERNGQTTKPSDDLLWDESAERATVASMMLAPSKTDEVRKAVTEFDFHSPAYRLVYRTLLGMYDAGKIPDPVTLVEELRASGSLEMLGQYNSAGSPIGFVRELFDLMPTGDNASFYAEIVANKATLRRQLRGLDEARQVLTSRGGMTSDERADEARLILSSTFEPERRSLAPMGIAQMCDEYPALNEPVIEGIVRRGETVNIVSASKFGKSWLMYGMLMSVAAGLLWLDRFRCVQGRVLLIDNELHKPTLAHRIKTVADAMALPFADLANWFDVISLRGQHADLYSLRSILSGLSANRYSLVIADAWYRFFPPGVSENDNAQVMSLYNTVDAYAMQLGVAWVNVHHSSKGSQGTKSVTDVGSGAGAQSRAADSHLVLREHEEEGVVVLEAALRSFAPLEPLPLQWRFPLWLPAHGIDPSLLKGRKPPGEERQTERDRDGKDKLLGLLADGPRTLSWLYRNGGPGRQRCERLLSVLIAEGRLTTFEDEAANNPCTFYQITPGALVRDEVRYE